MPIKGQGRNCDILSRISESFQPFIKEILKELNFGLCRSKVDFEKLRNSTNSKTALADQFTIILPYAGHYLRWEVLFDATCPWYAPDFRFDDENFLANVDATCIEKHVPSLAKWNDDDPKALSNVIEELIALYREHQKTLLGEDENSRAYFEYTTLIGDSNTQEHDVEIFVGRGDSVNFMIKLNIDYSQLPALFSDDCNIHENPGGECAVLLIKYPNPSNAELIMSPLINRAVGDITLPPIHQTAVLMDYVPMVTNLINKKIKTIFDNERHRQEMLSRFIIKYEGGILEHDSNSASFLLEVNDFYCILQIEIGLNFPEKPPMLSLRSVYHSHKRRPRVKPLPLCPYDRIQEYISQQMEIFKAECSDAVVAIPPDNILI